MVSEEPREPAWRPVRISRKLNKLRGRAVVGGRRQHLLYDVFICHASEDKEAFVRPLAAVLRERHIEVCYDEFTLTIGDSIRRAIDAGLSQSRFAADFAGAPDADRLRHGGYIGVPGRFAKCMNIGRNSRIERPTHQSHSRSFSGPYYSTIS